jgi:hypothetical protein
LVFFEDDDDETIDTFDDGCCIAVLLSVPMREKEKEIIQLRK